MSRTRRHFSTEQKADIVRRHLAGKEAVSDLAEEFGVQPSLIHHWVNQLLSQAERAFDRVVNSYPDSDVAGLAREQLRELR